jgi:hypothetical protein
MTSDGLEPDTTYGGRFYGVEAGNYRIEVSRPQSAMIQVRLLPTKDQAANYLSGLLRIDVPRNGQGPTVPVRRAAVRSLAGVDLNGSRVTDATLDRLAQLTALREVHLTDTEVTETGVRKLQQALPLCKIFWNPPTTDGR